MHRSSNRWPGEELARALRPLENRVMTRYGLESLRLALLWGLAAASAALALLWLYPLLPVYCAYGAGTAAALAVAGLRVHRRPDALAVVHVADGLGLDGDAVTAYRLLESGGADEWSRAAAVKGIAACKHAGANIAGIYPVVPAWRQWQGVALLAVLFVVLQVVPNPLVSYWAERQVRQEELRAAALIARQAVERVEDLQVNGENVLPEDVQKKLAGLPRDITKARNKQEAAGLLERARWQLDEARKMIPSTAGQDLNRLAETWGKMQGQQWKNLAAALKKNDAAAIDKAVADLAAALQNAGTEQKEKAAAAMFQGSGVVKDAFLRQALREAAGSVMDSGSQAAGAASGGAAGQGLAAAAGKLSGALAGMAEAAGAGSALGNSSESLAGLASSLSGTGGAMALAVGGTGSAGSINGPVGSGAGDSLPGEGAAAGGTGQGDGSGDNGGSGSGDGDGAGSGNGNGNGTGTGSGGNGSGGAGAGRSGGGLDLIYTPLLPGSEADPSRVAGQIRQGEQGTEINLESSPTTLGAVRPYSDVYGQYMAEAHDSLSRAPLPPDMEKLVWQYFSALGEANAEN